MALAENASPLFFRKTLALAQELCDRAVEAQACYSLGNTYTLLRDYPCAIHYHLRHLAIAQVLTAASFKPSKCYDSPTSGEAYRDRQLTTNFEFSVEIFCVLTCFHVRIPKPCLSVHLSIPREKKSPKLRQYHLYVSN